MKKLDSWPSLSSTESALDHTYLALAKDWSLWDDTLQAALRRITEVLSEVLNVSRISIWTLNEANDGFGPAEPARQQ